MGEVARHPARNSQDDRLKEAGASSPCEVAQRRATTDRTLGQFAAASNFALVTTASDGHVTFWNDAAERMFGHARRDVLGASIDLIIPERFRGAHHTGMARLASGGQSALAGRSVEVIAIKRSGEEFPIEITLCHWHGPTGAEFGAQMQDITERRQREARLQHLARHDDLTGLLNRGGFRDAIATELGSHGGASLLALDLDGFKSVNDTLGHAIGDTLLQTAAVRMATCASADGILGRIGGDEFAMLLPYGYDIEAVETVSRALLDAFAKPFEVAGHTVQIGTSIGIAHAPTDADEVDELLLRADLALFRAKSEGGRCRWRFDASLGNQLAARRAFGDELLEALPRGEWRLAYQPQVRLSDNAIIGAEALLRWDHPRRGLLLPDAFMESLESHLVAYEVGRWALDEACRQLAEWRRSGLDLPQVSVNLFAAQFRAGTLETMVSDTLARHALAPADLELEITETIALGHNDELLAPLQALHTAGVGIAFDDFGTGYASLSTLRRFPITRLKIDRSFVQDIVDEPHSAAIVSGMIATVRSLGLDIVAEGIESEAQRLRLIELGCDQGQGYHFARPMTPAELAGRLAAQGCHVAHRRSPPVVRVLPIGRQDRRKRNLRW